MGNRIEREREIKRYERLIIAILILVAIVFVLVPLLWFIHYVLTMHKYGG